MSSNAHCIAVTLFEPVRASDLASAEVAAGAVATGAVAATGAAIETDCAVTKWPVVKLLAPPRPV